MSHRKIFRGSLVTIFTNKLHGIDCNDGSKLPEKPHLVYDATHLKR